VDFVSVVRDPCAAARNLGPSHVFRHNILKKKTTRVVVILPSMHLDYFEQAQEMFPRTHNGQIPFRFRRSRSDPPHYVYTTDPRPSTLICFCAPPAGYYPARNHDLPSQPFFFLGARLSPKHLRCTSSRALPVQIRLRICSIFFDIQRRQV
jgi:hypothetical protein